MAQTTLIQTSIIAGEITPSLFGRTDLVKWRNGASTLRNMYVDYRGGASSRAGTAYVGTCKQTGQYSPRDIPFQYNINEGFVLEFGELYMRIKYRGAYVVETEKSITAITNANPSVLTIPAHALSIGDWIYIQDCTGQTYYNGLSWIVSTVVDANNIRVTDLFGNVVDLSGSSATYLGAGTAARIYTVVSPYAAVDLPYLKYTQDDNTMTLTCVNTATNTEYLPYDLQRVAATNWVFTENEFQSSISAPTGVVVTAHASAALTTYYSYVVTAVSRDNGDESIASTHASAQNNDISILAGSNSVSWAAVSGASSYNIYRATPSYSVAVPGGSAYYFVGESFGTEFTDNNIISDSTRVPPQNKNPFARGAILAVDLVTTGSGYTSGTVGYTITTSTGSGFVGVPILYGVSVTAFVVINSGEGYAPTDTITITDSGVGTGATATLDIGPQTGTYPSTTAYHQQRRYYANTLNAPDTYFGSQPSSYLNMDSGIPTVDDDAIIGKPWAQQVNGIQWMVSMPKGLIILTGKGAWALSGGSNAAITPIDQNATPQAYNGCSALVPPLNVNYNILYVQAKGSIVRNIEYNFFSDIYTGTDMTVLSNHLFQGYTINQWAWAEEPYKLAWAIRNDGTVLSFTFLKEQDVYAWARHDTNGQFVSICSITEPPVDAVYFITKRYVQGDWRYYSERMNNRTWQNVEECFCVDSGLQYPMPAPNAELAVSATTGAVTMTASAAVFTANDIGSILRVGGGKITVTGYTSSTLINGTVTETITKTVPNDPNNMPLPAPSGTWTLTVPTTTVSGLNHLEGMEVAILADGGVVDNQIVTDGTITLPEEASAIVVGLPFTAQFQSMYIDPPSQDGSTQTKRKTINSVGLRFQATRGVAVGTNQPDASVQPNNANVPWTGMIQIKERNNSVDAGVAMPLYTGDYFINVGSGWDTKSQVALEQNFPLPVNLLCLVPYINLGDS